MADKRISDLTSASSITLADLLVLVNDSQTKKTTVGDLLNLIISQETFAQLDVDGTIPLEMLPDSLFGAVTYQASWNADTNTPALPTAAPENKGWYYVVGTAGSTNVGGIDDWAVGDWVISNGSVWQKVDNTDAVSSWNGREGAVVPETGDYTTSQVPEGTNKYYTAARVLAEALDGLTVEDEEITPLDSILSALGKLQGQIDTRELLENKGVPGGYASLDGSGIVTASQLPASLSGAVNYQGTWDATTTSTSTGLNLTSTPASSANKGWYFVVSVNGLTSVGGIAEWKVGDWVISNGTTWQKVDNSDAVSSVHGRMGAVVGVSGDYNTSLVTEHSSNLYYTPTRVRNETLTGFSANNAAIVAGDNIVQAFGKAQGQITSLLGAVRYQGTWDATTTTTSTGLVITTTSASSTNKGWYFIVSANGSQTVGGISEWKIGDWVISNGTAWQKVDLSNTVTSVHGRIGAVVAGSGDYSTTQVTEGSNWYYTGARVRAEVLTGLNPVSGTISSGDSVLSAFNKIAGALPAKENTANKGAASGYASLDSNTRLPKAQLTRGQTAIDLDFTGWNNNSSTETLKYSFQIPAGVFAAGDQLNIEAWIGGANTSNAKTVKIYFNTSASLSGATAIGTYTFTTGVMSTKMSRDVSFLTNTTMKCGVLPATSSLNGESAGALDSTATTIPSVSSGFYVIISLKGFTGFPSGDSVYLDRVILKGLYA